MIPVRLLILSAVAFSEGRFFKSLTEMWGFFYSYPTQKKYKMLRQARPTALLGFQLIFILVKRMKERHKEFNKKIAEQLNEILEKKGLTLAELEERIARNCTEEKEEEALLMTMELGMRIRDTRENQGLSLEQLA